MNDHVPVWQAWGGYSVKLRTLLQIGAGTSVVVVVLVFVAQRAFAAQWTVGIHPDGFRPSSIMVAVGDSVMWSNKDTNTHTVTFFNGMADSGDLNTNETFSFTFNQAGSFGYYCRYHSFMTGSVIVTAAAVDPTPIPTAVPTPVPTSAPNPNAPLRLLIPLVVRSGPE